MGLTDPSKLNRQSAQKHLRPLTESEGPWSFDRIRFRPGRHAHLRSDRITDVKLSTRWFERPKDFSVERYFAQAFSVMKGAGDNRVRIRFDALAADHVRDRFWHESKDFVELPGRERKLRLRVSDLL